MTKIKKIVLAVAAVLIVSLLVFAKISGGAMQEVKCMDCFGDGLVDVDCETCEAEGKINGVDCVDCSGDGKVESTCETCVNNDGVGTGKVVGSLWAMLPPVIAIGLALITKEVYSSLFIGVLAGGILSSNFSVTKTMDAVINDGLISSVSGSAGIFIFLVELGIIVALVNRAGGSAAFGRWAVKNIKTRAGATIATFILGVLIFIDDYFNCLTVGSVMRPVTDSHKISRAKLSYLIDATAAPVCMIAPISSWAAAVSSYAPKGEGIALFCKAIPYNFYSLLTFVFIIAITYMKFDYGLMAKHEMNAIKNGDLFTSGERNVSNEEAAANENGIVLDLVLPIIILIATCVFALVYVGGYFEGESFINAFANTDATVGLPWGGLISLIAIIIYFNIRRLVNLKESMDAVPKGFIAMVPAILILTFATSLKNMTSLLGAKHYVAVLMEGAAASLYSFLPAIIFLVACVLSFATGTSWGTFGILIPVVTNLFLNAPDSPLMIIGISACLAGAVCGDHCSPISDTTIMASAGAQCDHINHVSTQLPYALTVAAVSFVSYIIAGFITNWMIALPIAIVLMIATLFVIKFFTGRKKA